MSTADWRSRSIFSLLRVVEREQDRVASVRLCIQSIATGIECGRDCKTSPYKFCTGLSINLYPQKFGNTKPIWETRLWYNLMGEVVQSLYGLLFEQSSPSIFVAIDCTPDCVQSNLNTAPHGAAPPHGYGARKRAWLTARNGGSPREASSSAAVGSQ